jgi:hypothetical protein
MQIPELTLDDVHKDSVFYKVCHFSRMRNGSKSRMGINMFDYSFMKTFYFNQIYDRMFLNNYNKKKK